MKVNPDHEQRHAKSMVPFEEFVEKIICYQKFGYDYMRANLNEQTKDTKNFLENEGTLATIINSHFKSQKMQLDIVLNKMMKEFCDGWTKMKADLFAVIDNANQTMINNVQIYSGQLKKNNQNLNIKYEDLQMKVKQNMFTFNSNKQLAEYLMFFHE